MAIFFDSAINFFAEGTTNHTVGCGTSVPNAVCHGFEMYEASAISPK